MNEIETKFYKTLMNAEKQGIFECLGGNYYSLSNSNVYFDIKIHPNEDFFSGYIPDFAFTINGLTMGYVVEIDGYQWHEKSKEQARIDKEKDRAYLRNNFIPVRFAGFEVYHNPEGCIHELFEIMRRNERLFEFETLKNELRVNSKFMDYLENKVDTLEAERGDFLPVLIQDGKIRVHRNMIEIGA